MLEICFYAEKRSLDPDDLSFHRWRTICTAFGVDRCFIIDKTEMREHLANKIDNLPCEAFIVDDFEEIDSLSLLQRVFVEKDVPLNRTAVPFYAHDTPADVLFCFGGDHCGMQQAWYEQETDLAGDWIIVPTDDALWADQVAAIVIAHYRVIHANS